MAHEGEVERVKYTPHTPTDRQRILDAIGVKQFEDLVKGIPSQIPKAQLELPLGLTEPEVMRRVEALAKKNLTTQTHACFMGAGAYEHWIPSVVRYLSSRGEFLTAYTPYQAEASQGSLQALYEFQTLWCELTGMEVANASLYDGATALAEAALLALRETERSKLVVAGAVHPESIEVLRTYLAHTKVEIITSGLEAGVASLKDAKAFVDEKTAAVIVQQPNFLGALEPVEALGKLAKSKGALYIVAVEPVSLGVLKPPGVYGADIVVAEGQSLGLELNYGGPYLGLFACKSQFLRKIPGRISGMTVDTQGRRGFTLTLQTREQHIRRSKATSNICTNETMCALTALFYLGALGKGGFQDLAVQNTAKAHYLYQELLKVPGFKPLFEAPFFNEFALKTPIPVADLNEKLLSKGFLGGVDLGVFQKEWSEGWLLCATETKSKESIDAFVETVGEVTQG